MMNTLFNLVDACLFSDLVVFYENKVRLAIPIAWIRKLTCVAKRSRQQAGCS